MERLFEYMRRMLADTPNHFHRYLYSKVNWGNRMLGIVGPRGVGKTTLLLQRILEAHSLENTLYISADFLYFADHTLYDTAETFVKHGGKYLFVDEVHKYPGWSRELKTIYDTLPDVSVYFTGSSILDIEKGEADLSRRAPKYELQGLSFREYLAMGHNIITDAFTLSEVLEHKASIEGLKHPLPLFQDYLRRGYYPFGSDANFEIELGQVIRRTLENDIPLYVGMNSSTGRKLMRLMAVISESVPLKPNLVKIGGKIQVSRNNIEDYLAYLEKAGMIAQLRTGATGLGALGKVEKVYLDNPNILHVLGSEKHDKGTVRETFFFNQMRVSHLVTGSDMADFEIDGMVFEVEGKNKTRAQLKNTHDGFVVKDDIEYGHGKTIPLWTFGLTY